MPSAVLRGPGILRGRFRPPGDKSISHRVLIFGALAKGASTFHHFLTAEDCLATLKIFQFLGVPIRWEKTSEKIVVEGVGLSGLKAPSAPLDCGNSGTTMRLLLGVLAGQPFGATLTGDESLSRRPMRRVTQPLKEMGAQIKGRENANFAPLTIHGGRLKAIDFDNRLASAQVKSAILLAGLYAEGSTKVRERVRSRDHTERLLKACGAKIQDQNGLIQIEKTDQLCPLEMKIPGDISAAAFFLVGAAMTPGSEITVENMGTNPTRTGVLEVLKRMGASLSVQETQKGPEPMATVTIQGKRLRGTRITKQEIPALIDELPILMIGMALAEGESLISGAEELRVKETDRIHSMVTNLKAVGGQLEELPDGCLIRGVESFRPAEVKSFGDHRTAMSLAIASLAVKGEMRIDDTACVATSFPSFFQDFKGLHA